MPFSMASSMYSLPFFRIPVIQLKWFSPTYSILVSTLSICRFSQILSTIFTGTLQSPTTRIELWSEMACVIIPDGFVKLIRKASGQSFSILFAISSITGIVRKALKKPPIPVVSCPIKLYFNGIDSSKTRAGSFPTRICATTKRLSFNAISISFVRITSHASPAAFTILWHSCPTIDSFLSSMSIKRISSNFKESLCFIIPSINSGV